MILYEKRLQLVEWIEEARDAGARLTACCEIVGIDPRTYQRWKETEDGSVKRDGRPEASRPTPNNKTSEEEREAILEICHRPEFASLPPSQIVPKLADSGVYIASESTFYRVLREANEQHHRGRSKRPQSVGAPSSYAATGPCQVWTWDITWLPGPVQGYFFYLYLIIDIYSRKIVGWEVHERESSELASKVVHQAILAENCIGKLRVLHADNGSPQKGTHLTALLERLGVERSHSRPRVSNDNPYSESIFRTCKYRPSYPSKGFETIADARDWVHHFVHWYNDEHQHSRIKFVTPSQRHSGKDKEILEARKRVYEEAKAKNPSRWSRTVKNFEPIDVVYLNPTETTKRSSITNPF